MSVVSLPAAFSPRTCALVLATNQRVSASPFGGTEQAVDLLNDRWYLSCVLPAGRQRDGAWRDAFIAGMRGQVNWVPLWHFARPQPRGTARGTMMVDGSVAQGASAIPVDGISPSTGTLLAGDMLGVGGRLFMVADDVTASGGGATVQVVNRVRTALTDNALVTWDKPTALFRLLSAGEVQYEPGAIGTTQFDFGEYIAS